MFRKLFNITTVLLLVASSNACSNFYMQNDYRLSGRTMDLGSLPLHAGFTLMSYPVGTSTLYDRRGTNELGFVGFVPSKGELDLRFMVTAGINTAGVSCDMQTLLGTGFAKKQNSTVDLGASSFCEWLLGTFSNVASAKQALLNGSVHVHSDLMTNDKAGQHFSARDSTGASIVVEYIDGALKLYDDPNDGEKGIPLDIYPLSKARYIMLCITLCNPIGQALGYSPTSRNIPGISETSIISVGSKASLVLRPPCRGGSTQTSVPSASI
jgi:penicillin V acylase-like amidase (Ntn superfamily)